MPPNKVAVASLTLTFTDTRIIDNLKGEDVIYAVHSNLSFMGVNNVTTKTVYALSSRVEFNGPTTLSSNRGVQGGAIRALRVKSILMQKEWSFLTIQLCLEEVCF